MTRQSKSGPKPKAPRETRTVRIDLGLWPLVEAEAEREGCNASDVINEALAEYLREKGAKPSG